MEAKDLLWVTVCQRDAGVTLLAPRLRVEGTSACSGTDKPAGMLFNIVECIDVIRISDACTFSLALSSPLTSSSGKSVSHLRLLCGILWAVPHPSRPSSLSAPCLFYYPASSLTFSLASNMRLSLKSHVIDNQFM